MKIAFIGHGNVGGALASNLVKVGYDVSIGVREINEATAGNVKKLDVKLKLNTLAEVINESDIIFLAVPYPAVASIAESFQGVSGKIIVDCTNPVGPGLSHGLDSKVSGSETLQKLVGGNQVVKAFTIYGFENFRNPKYEGYGSLKPAMLMAGNDKSAKRMIAELITDLGFEPVDTGDISMSLHLEHMTLLWIKMARAQGKGPNFTWAMLER